MWCKAEFLLQASVSHDPSEIILMICLYADFLIIINAKKSCATIQKFGASKI